MAWKKLYTLPDINGKIMSLSIETAKKQESPIITATSCWTKKRLVLKIKNDAILFAGIRGALESAGYLLKTHRDVYGKDKMWLEFTYYISNDGAPYQTHYQAHENKPCTMIPEKIIDAQFAYYEDAIRDRDFIDKILAKNGFLIRRTVMFEGVYVEISYTSDDQYDHINSYSCRYSETVPSFNSLFAGLKEIESKLRKDKTVITGDNETLYELDYALSKISIVQSELKGSHSVVFSETGGEYGK